MIETFKFLFGFAVILTIYWALVRPLLLDKVKADLLDIKSRMDWAIIDNLEGSRSKAGNIFENEIRDVSNSNGASISVLLAYSLRGQTDEILADIAREEIVFTDAPKWLKNLKDEATNHLFKRLIINSPLWWVPITFVLFLALFSAKVSSYLEKIKLIAAYDEEESGITC